MQVDVDEGVLIVAYPKDSTEDEFSFEYWVDATLKPPAATESENQGETNAEAEKEKEEDGGVNFAEDLTFVILCGTAGCILILIIVLCMYWRKSNKMKTTVAADKS